MCASAAVWHYLPFAYDSVVAVASGLDQLVEREGVAVADITGPQLIQAIVKRPFEGASGNVTLTITLDVSLTLTMTQNPNPP